MKVLHVLVVLLFTCGSVQAVAQQPENWTQNQLLQPAQLAKQINEGKNVPVVICVGPGATIPNSIAIGQIKDTANLAKLADTLQTLKRDAAIVVYCGCCPFEHCPNVRPAIALLKDLQFTNYKLLNLPRNIKADWIDKGYPASKL